VRRDVLRERLLAPVADLPVREQIPRAEREPPYRPAQERHPSAADFGEPAHAFSFASSSPIFWCRMLIALSGRTITLKSTIRPASSSGSGRRR
jgi:hypothetical protein